MICSICEISIGPKIKNHFCDDLDKFKKHYEKWERETCFQSFGRFNHPDYLSIIQMGETAIPFILQIPELIELGKLKSNLSSPRISMIGHWSVALHQISKENILVPYLPDVLEKMRKIAELWQEWGKDKEYI